MRPVGSVLGDGVLDGLASQRVFQLRGGHRYPVDEQSQVNSSRSVRFKRQLTRDRQHVRLIQLGKLWRAPLSRLEVRQLDLDVPIHNPRRKTSTVPRLSNSDANRCTNPDCAWFGSPP